MRSLSAVVLAAGLVFATAPAKAETGTVSVELTNIFAVAGNGNPLPALDPVCATRFASLRGTTVESRYDINTTTGMMLAVSNVLGVDVVLHPLGISGEYAFMSDGVPAELAAVGITRVILDLDSSFGDPESDVMATLTDTVNCVASNKSAG